MINENFKFWWDLSPQDIPQSIFEHVVFLTEKQSSKLENDQRNARLYGDKDAMSVKDISWDNQRLGRLSLNVISILVDTKTSRIAKNKPRPKFLTTNGDITMQRKAEKLEAYVSGLIEKDDLHSKMQLLFRHSEVFGTGAIKMIGDEKTGDITSENIPTSLIVVDELDAMYGNPTFMYEVRVVNRQTMIEAYPKFAKELSVAAGDSLGFFHDIFDTNTLLVVEAFYLGGEHKKGKHCICVSNKVLFAEDWEEDFFPYTFERSRSRITGFWGQGVPERIIGMQVEINKLLRVAQTSAHLGLVPKVYIDAMSSINTNHLNNEIGGVVKYTGKPPIFGQMFGLPAGLMDLLNYYYSKSFEIEGVSQLSSSGQKPAGINSGRGLREYNDIETERFALQAQQHEKAYINHWKLYLKMSKRLSRINKKLSVISLDRNGIEKLYFKDVDLDKDKYVLGTYAANLLSQQPSGRMEDVLDMVNGQLIDRETALDLFDFPDTERFFQVANAKKRNILTVIEAIVDKGVYYPPTEYQDLARGVVMMNDYMLYYLDRNLEPERIDMFARWISDAQMLLSIKQQQNLEQQIQMAQAMQPATAPTNEKIDMGAAPNEIPTEAQQTQI